MLLRYLREHGFYRNECAELESNRILMNIIHYPMYLAMICRLHDSGKRVTNITRPGLLPDAKTRVWLPADPNCRLVEWTEEKNLQLVRYSEEAVEVVKLPRDRFGSEKQVSLSVLCVSEDLRQWIVQAVGKAFALNYVNANKCGYYDDYFTPTYAVARRIEGLRSDSHLSVVRGSEQNRAVLRQYGRYLESIL